MSLVAIGFNKKRVFAKINYVIPTKYDMLVLQKNVLKSGIRIETKIFTSVIIEIKKKEILCRISTESRNFMTYMSGTQNLKCGVK